MTIRMFKPQFAPMVLSGEKCQTIRPTPKRMPKPGERISLRQWTGKPYRSKQRVLRESIISEVQPVAISTTGIKIDGRPLDDEWAFARADGFNTPQDLLDWFNFTHGLPFDGVVIKWQNDRTEPSGVENSTLSKGKVNYGQPRRYDEARSHAGLRSSDLFCGGQATNNRRTRKNAGEWRTAQNRAPT